mgnify:CR=1 FL=1
MLGGIAVMGWEVAGSQLVAFVVGGVTAGSAVLGLVDKRRREITQTWRELAEAKTAEASDCDERMTKLEARVDLLQSSFVDRIATHVAQAVLEAVHHERQ